MRYLSGSSYEGDGVEYKEISAASISSKNKAQKWSKYFDKDSGYYFYVNEETGESTWDEPSECE